MVKWILAFTFYDITSINKANKNFNDGKSNDLNITFVGSACENEDVEYMYICICILSFNHDINGNSQISINKKSDYIYHM